MQKRYMSARRRRIKHSAQIIAFLLRLLAVFCFVGVVGAVGGMEMGGSIREGVKLLLTWSAVGGLSLLVSEAIEKAVRA